MDLPTRATTPGSHAEASAPLDAPLPRDGVRDLVHDDLLAALYERLPHGVVVQDAKGRIVAANAGARRVLGIALHTLGAGATSAARWSAVDERDRELPDDELPAAVALRTGQPVRDRLVRLRDGARCWLRVDAMPWTPPGAPSDAATHVCSVFTDVTEEIEAERAARFLADAATRLLTTLDLEATLAELTTLAVPFLADWCAIDVVEGGRIRRVAVHHHDPARRELAERLRERYPPRPDARDGVGAVVRTGVETVVHDITDDALARMTHDAEHLALARAIGVHAVAIVPLAMRGRVLGTLSLVRSAPGGRFGERTLATARDLAGRAAIALDHARLFDELRDELRRRTAAEGELRAANRELDERRLQLEEQQVELEMTNAQLQEQQVELEATNAQLQEQQAELELQAEELRVTAERLQQHVEELEQARRHAEEANAAKSQFLAAMSHELRTPLNAVTGYVDLLELELRGPLTAYQKEDLARIRRSAEHLLRLINDILQFAKLEAGQLEFDIGPVPLAEALGELEALVAPQVRAREVHFAQRVAPECPVARADRSKVHQIVLNLLSNAVKATEPGGHVWLEVDTAGAAGAGRMARVRVVDTGCGIPADKLATIFDPFTQLDRQLNRPTDGIGLGLTISRDLARMMGGELSVESEVGRGSTFTLTLPLA